MELSNTKKLLTKMYDEKTFGFYGVLVYRNGERELIMSENINEDTYFDVASMGKVLVTSTLILKAISKGMLKLEDTLDMFFDDVPQDRTKITVQQLLTHTSGIVRCPIPDRVADCGKDAIASHIINKDLAYNPGENYIYSCNGYILLGFILEKVFNMNLDEIYNEYLVKPLGLTRSKFNVALDEPNTAVCYRWKQPGKIPVDDENVYTMGGVAGNGASFTSIADIERFIKAVMQKSDKLYSKELFDLAEQDYTPNYLEGRGLGYLMPDDRYHQTGELFPKGSFGHCGHCGHSFFINREEDMYVVIFTNATRYLRMKNDFKGYDYSIVKKMREDIHNAIKSDITK